MACRHCEEVGHNAATCPYVTRCGACGDAGHNVRTCPNARRCRICDAVDHDARNCGEATRADRPLVATVGRLYRNTPIPLGAKLVNLGNAGGWFDRSLLKRRKEDREVLADRLDRLPVFEQLGAAFRALVATVHKASKHRVYVGLAGSTPCFAPTPTGCATSGGRRPRSGG